MKTAKKLTVIILAFLMVFSLSACRGLKIVKEIATVDGNMITKGEFLYYLENIKSQMLQEAGIDAITAEETNFWESEIDGVKVQEAAKNKALEEAIRIEMACLLAKEKNLSVDSETMASIKASVGSNDPQQAAQIEEIKNVTGLSSDMIIKLFEKTSLANVYAQYLSVTSPETVTPEDDAAKAKYAEDYVRVKHILIANTPSEEETEATDLEAYKNEKKLLAAEVLGKVQSGTNFESLIKQYGEDPGTESSPDGYTFTRNSGMVAEFEDAAFDIEIGKTSELVETAYGWHILKRYELLTSGEEYDQYIGETKSALAQDMYNEYLDGLKSNYEIVINESAVKGIKIK